MANLNTSSPQIQLGLCNPPEPIYLYVGHKEVNGETYLWYQYDVEGEQLHPVLQRGLTGYVSELRITVKEFKGKENTKIDVVVRADQVYIIRSGLETNFSKTLLLALACVIDFNQPLTVAVAAGEENVVFARLYDASTRHRLKPEWNPDADWFNLVSQLQQQLGQSYNEPLTKNSQIPSSSSVQEVLKPVPPNSNGERIKAIRTRTGHSADDIRAMLVHYGTDHPKHLDSAQCDRLIESLVSDWYSALHLPEQFSVADYRQRVEELRQSGFTEADATTAWMSEVSR